MSGPWANTLRQIPSGIWVLVLGLGLVSMLMDISSEMVHSLLPMFMETTLGMSVLVVGLIEGMAESTALIVKIFSGALSDYLGKRKGLAVLGYAMGALSKPLFAMAPGIGLVVTARLIDRLGKGIRSENCRTACRTTTCWPGACWCILRPTSCWHAQQGQQVC